MEKETGNKTENGELVLFLKEIIRDIDMCKNFRRQAMKSGEVYMPYIGACLAGIERKCRSRLDGNK